MSTKWGRARRWAPAVAVACGVAPYAGSLFGSFTFDDAHTILGHPGVRGALSFHAIVLRDFWGHASGDPAGVATWRPVPTLTYWIDWHLGGGRPWVFHLTNLLLFTLVLLAFDALLRRLAEAASPWTRALAIAGFAAMAIHADVVPSATGSAELFAALFALVATERALRSPFRPTDAAVMAACALLGFASKESIAPMIPYLAVLGLRGTRPLRERLVVVGTAIGVGLACVGTRLWLFPFHYQPALATVNPLITAPTGVRIRAAAEVLSHYFEHAAVGVDLCPDYSYAATAVHLEGIAARAIAGATLALCLLGASIASWRRLPRVADALLGLFASYSVASHVLFPATALVADRLFFLPSAFLVLALALSLDALAAARPRLRAPLVFGVVCVTLVQGTFAALVTSNWRDDASLWAYATETCPSGITIRINHAVIAYRAGDADEAAWQMLVAAFLIERYPAYLPPDTVPSAWESLPVDARAAALARLVGGERALAKLRPQAQYTALANGMGGLVPRLSRWPAPPPR